MACCLRRSNVTACGRSNARARSASRSGFDRSSRGCISRAHLQRGRSEKPPPMAQAAAAHGAEDGQTNKQFWALALGSIGVVYGDIGTSPLYALREAVTAAQHHGTPVPDAVLGILSLMTWTLVLIVTVKYVIVLLNADNKGEGGTFALMALGQSVAKRSAPLILVFGVVGAAFFYGDAVITPAISVLSAVEGLKLVAPALGDAVLPITVAILVALFAVQSRGTAAVAQFFGPI